MFVDTHCHLNMMVDKKFDQSLKKEDLVLISKIVKEARESGVNKIINVGTSVVETRNSIQIAQQEENVFVAAGIHPCDCQEDWKKDFEEIKKIVEDKGKNKVVAIGETGLDFYHKPFNKQRQVDAFKFHIELALKNDLPLVVHVRDSIDEVLRVLEEYKEEVRGVNHSFFGDEKIAETLISWGFYLGINAPITYPKNEDLRELVKTIPTENLLLETDAPFLPPQQFRGRQNHPKYIPLFAELIANLKGISLDELAFITTSNAKKLFNI